MSKDIELYYLSDDIYEQLYVITPAEKVIVNQNIVDLLDLSSNDLNSALMALIIPTGQTLYTIKVTFKGSPVSGLTVSGLQDLDSKQSVTMTTDSQGKVVGLGNSSSCSLTISGMSGYLDMKSGSISTSVSSSNIIASKTVTIDSNYQTPTFSSKYISSTSFKLWNTKIDIFAVGGGGSGAGFGRRQGGEGDYRATLPYATGGGSGYYITKTNVQVIRKQVAITIGSGAQAVSFYGLSNSNGNDGGNTIVRITGMSDIIANGGKGGIYGTSDYPSTSSVSGSGGGFESGGITIERNNYYAYSKPQSGESNTNVYPFGNSTYGLFGGGGGSCGLNADDYITDTCSFGGTPGGGSIYKDSLNGTNSGGGAAMTGSTSSQTVTTGAGGDGFVIIRVSP